MKLNDWAAALLLAAVASGAGVAAAEEAGKPANTKPATAAQASDAAPAMDEKAMMDAWMKVATPGEAHKWLEPMVGKWDTKITMWMAPGAPPQESTGSAENSWVLDGRFVEQRYQGSFMGQPFTGLGYTGYDNYKKKYVSSWMDTMGTMMMISQGDVAGKTLSLASTIDDILTGKTASVKSETKIVDADHHVMEMWGPDPAGQPFKSMEIHYTRKK